MATTDHLLSIVIVSYNTCALTLKAVQSACADIEDSPLLQGKADIWVIDNASSDDSVAELKNFAKKSSTPLTIIENKKNTGFAAANNQGLRQAPGKFFLLLNSDTIVQSGALEKMVRFLLERPLSLLAATLLNADGSIQPQGGSVPTLLALLCHMWMLDDIPVLGHMLPSTQHTGKRANTNMLTMPYQIGWVAGTAVMVSKDTLNEIGYLDENIFMYCEDIEWCMRAHNHAHEVYIHPGAYITHLQNKSGSPEQAILGEFRGLRYIWSKHKPLWQQRIALYLLKSGAYIRKIVFTLLGNSERSRIYSTIADAIE